MGVDKKLFDEDAYGPLDGTELVYLVNSAGTLEGKADTQAIANLRALPVWVETSVGFGAAPIGEADTVVAAPGCLPASVVEVEVVIDSAGTTAEIDAHRHAAQVWRMSVIPDTDQFELGIVSLSGQFYGFFTIRYKIT